MSINVAVVGCFIVTKSLVMSNSCVAAEGVVF